MATDRMCPHKITLFNFTGENSDGEAQFNSVLLDNVHVFHTEGVNSSNSADDAPHVHIFDENVSPSGGKTFVPYSQWKSAQTRDSYWTLNPEGGDYFAIGDHRQTGHSLPTSLTLFRITHVARREIGASRMWHWRIEAR